MRLPNLESLLARRSGSAAAWVSDAANSGTGGFTIPRLSARISEPREPFLTLGILSHSGDSVVISLDMIRDILTLSVRLKDDGHVDFTPTSVCLKDGTAPPEGMEPSVRHIDDFLGQFEIANAVASKLTNDVLLPRQCGFARNCEKA